MRRYSCQVIKSVDVGFATTQLNRELFEADESMTLIRTIVAGQYTNDLASDRADLAIHKSGQGATAPSMNAPSTTVGDLYASSGDEGLNLWSHGFRGNANQDETTIVYADVKGMRKLRKGEKIFMSGISTVAAAGAFHATVTMFFKE